MNIRAKCICTSGILFRTVAMALLAGAAQAQESRSSGSFSLNQDVFFGFYPQVNGSYKQNDRLDWTYYGIFWTTPSFGTGGGGGLWTEFGGGVNLKAWEGRLQFNPQLGVLNGKLLSNGSFPMALEGVVPNFTVNADAARVEGQFYLGYYLAARKGKAPAAGGGRAGNRSGAKQLCPLVEQRRLEGIVDDLGGFALRGLVLEPERHEPAGFRACIPLARTLRPGIVAGAGHGALYRRLRRNEPPGV